MRANEKLGYRVTVKTSSIEALEAFRKEPCEFDLIITDQTMPKMLGVELAGEILHVRSETPIILCTGFSETTAKEKAGAVGIQGFLRKPFTSRSIADLIRRILDERPSFEPLEGQPFEKDRLYRTSEQMNGGESSETDEAPVDSRSDHEAMDLAKLKVEYAGSEDLLKELISDFREIIPGKIEALKQSLEEKDCTQAGKIAHSLVGSFGVFNIGKCVEYSRSLEEAARNKDLEGALLFFDKLNEEMREVMRLLSQVSQQHITEYS